MPWPISREKAHKNTLKVHHSNHLKAVFSPWRHHFLFQARRVRDNWVVTRQLLLALVLCRCRSGDPNSKLFCGTAVVVKASQSVFWTTCILEEVSFSKQINQRTPDWCSTVLINYRIFCTADEITSAINAGIALTHSDSSKKVRKTSYHQTLVDLQDTWLCKEFSANQVTRHRLKWEMKIRWFFLIVHTRVATNHEVYKMVR